MSTIEFEIYTTIGFLLLTGGLFTLLSVLFYRYQEIKDDLAGASNAGQIQVAENFKVSNIQNEPTDRDLKNQLLDLCLESSGQGSFIVHIDTREIEFNKSWLPRLGYIESGMTQDFDFVLNLVSPEDKLRVLSVFEKGESFDLSFRMTTSQGVEILVNAMGRSSDDGKLIGTLKLADESVQIQQGTQMAPVNMEAAKIRKVEMTEEVEELEGLLDTIIMSYRDCSSKIIRDQHRSRIQISRDEWSEIIKILLDNAVESTSKSRNDLATITVSTGSGFFGLESCSICDKVVSGESYYLSVSTQGTEVPEHFLPFLFEKTFTTKKIAKQEATGLYHLKELVHGLKGHVILTSDSDRIEFRICLPYLKEPSAVKDSTFHLLIVDDQESLSAYLAIALKKEAIQVTSFQNANSAIEYLNIDHQRVDLLISDIHLPDMEGGKLVQKVQEISPSLPVVLCSGDDRERIFETARELDVYGCLSKPVNMTELLKMIDSLRSTDRSSNLLLK